MRSSHENGPHETNVRNTVWVCGLNTQLAGRSADKDLQQGVSYLAAGGKQYQEYQMTTGDAI